MSPVIGSSVYRITPNCWSLGSNKICECVPLNSAVPANALISWNSGTSVFYLRSRVEGDSFVPHTDLNPGLLHAAGTSAAIWSLGEDTLCKVKSWCEGVESESATIAFVRRKAPSIPLPEVIFTWIDHEWNRSFLIVRRVIGRTLDEAWATLAIAQKEKLALQITNYCSILASITSNRLASATGLGLGEPLFNHDDNSHPSWKPRPFGPMSLQEFSHSSAIRHTMDPDSLFHFYHADLGPGNIILSNSAGIQAIIDWESAGFYPRFWVASKVISSAGFYLQTGKRTERFAWRDLLSRKLKDDGFESQVKE